jgi:hypothetical protein
MGVVECSPSGMKFEPVCEKAMEIEGHWMHNHPKGMQKGGPRDEGNADTRFQQIWNKDEHVAGDFRIWSHR